MISFEYAIPEQTQNSIECINQLRNINSNYLFNYSSGDGLNWDLEEWITAQDLIKRLSDPSCFKNKDAGDIYAKLPN